MHVTRNTTRRKNRWQIKRAAAIALSKRMNEGKARKRLAEPAPDYPPIVDTTKPFFEASLKFGERVEQWAVYPGKKRAHRLLIDGEPWTPDGKRRHSVSAISAEFRKRLAMVERRLRFGVLAQMRGSEDDTDQ